MDAHPEMQSNLGRQVCATAEAVDAEGAARRHRSREEGAVADDARTLQRRRMLITDLRRQDVHVALVGNTRIGVAALDIPAGKC